MSFTRVLLLFEQERYDLAEKELRQALTADPENARAHALLALSLCQQRKDWEALHVARQAVHLEPGFAESHYTLGRVLNRMGKTREAELAVQHALQLNPAVAAYWNLLASLYLRQRAWQKTLEAAEQGLSREPEHAGCANLRAKALVKLGRQRESSLTLAASLAREPENALTHANQGWLLLSSGHHQRAMEHFREALRLNPTLEWARTGIVQALKARNPLYRVLLQAFSWMSKLTTKVQWLVVLGGYFVFRLVSAGTHAVPDLALVGGVFVMAYLLFVYLTWTSETLFNLLLRLNPFGRLVLDPDQITASNLAGTSLLVGLVGLILWLVTYNPLALGLGIWGTMMVIPIGGTFKPEAGSKRRLLAGFALILGLLGLAGIFLPPALACFGPGILAFCIVANIMVRRS
jgi:tetratricopeptide (TPR) repeat protein